jgi:hypothetical protein
LASCRLVVSVSGATGAPAIIFFISTSDHSCRFVHYAFKGRQRQRNTSCKKIPPASCRSEPPAACEFALAAGQA